MFEYKRPTHLSEVCELLQRHNGGAMLLAGGTDLMVRIKAGHLVPEVVVDLKHVRELDGDILENGEGLRIGALAPMSDVENSPLVREKYPALSEAAHVVGSIQIRNRATLAGNICNASPAADTAPALLVYGAQIHLAGPLGSRVVPIEEFFLGFKSTALQPGEVVQAIVLPFAQPASGAAFERLTRRRGVDLATVNAACLVQGDGVTRFALGAVAPIPLLVVEEQGILCSANSSKTEKENALQQLAAQASPISDVRAGQAYRAAMLLVLMRRALARALARTEKVS